MSYLVLARKWRPQGFEDLIGQGPIVRILTNSIEQDKIAHAYIFSGPRGVGKTPSPCGKCPSCTGITEGHSVDVIEIDGASNNSVDDIRDLRERVKYAPSGGKHKVYIIDESHMLSTQAFNALLKTLEEPPPHVVFVMATTEPRKIPLTVMSRCQHLPFKRISTEEIRERLSQIVDKEGISIADSALGMIARAADGSIRDSLTILDQVASFSVEIHDDDVKDLLGITDFKGLLDIATALLEGKRQEILSTVAELNDKGTDLRAFTRDLIKFFRDLLVAKLAKGPEGVLDASAEEMGEMSSLASKVSLEYVSLIIPELIKAEADVRTSFSPRIALEMALIKTSYLSMYRPVSDALAAISSGSSPLPSSPTPPQKEAISRPEPEPLKKQSLKKAKPRAEEPTPKEVTQEAAETKPEKPSRPTPEEVAQEPPATPSRPAPMDAKGLLEGIIDTIEDPRLSSKLTKATPELKDGVLVLSFKSNDANICADAVKEHLKEISGTASEVLHAPITVKVKVRSAHGRRTKKDVKEEAMSEPLVKEALDLFEGRVVDVKEVKD
jgi:DNA polymerase-3 subunit gamma/tau